MKGVIQPAFPVNGMTPSADSRTHKKRGSGQGSGKEEDKGKKKKRLLGR